MHGISHGRLCPGEGSLGGRTAASMSARAAERPRPLPCSIWADWGDKGPGRDNQQEERGTALLPAGHRSGTLPTGSGRQFEVRRGRQEGLWGDRKMRPCPNSQQGQTSKDRVCGDRRSILMGRYLSGGTDSTAATSLPASPVHTPKTESTNQAPCQSSGENSR